MAEDKDKKKKPEEKVTAGEASAEAEPKEAPPGEEAEGDAGGKPEEEVAEGAEKDTADKDAPVESKDSDLSDLITALAEHGINLDMDAIKSPKELVTHLTIALNALKGVLQPGVGGGMGGKTEEQPSSSLSHDAPVDPKVTDLQAKLAASNLKHITKRVNSMVANGQASPAKAKIWLSTLGEHQLGLCDDDCTDMQLKTVTAEIDYAEAEVPPGTLFADASKKLAAKAGGSISPTDNLSVDEIEPVEAQTWGGDGTIDPKEVKERAAKFIKEHNLD